MKIRRFPREEAARVGPGAYSMNKVLATLGEIAEGNTVSPKAMVLVCRWFGVQQMVRRLAKQCLRPNFDGHFRFPRKA